MIVAARGVRFKDDHSLEVRMDLTSDSTFEVLQCDAVIVALFPGAIERAATVTLVWCVETTFWRVLA